MKLLHWWRNLSVTKKIYGVVGVMALLITMELLTLLFAMSTLSAVRAFVGGESLWSKAQKQAVSNLQKYALTREREHYRAFRENLRVPLGDRKARLEMAKPNPKQSVIYEGFVEGKVHPDDIPGLIQLVRRFHKVSYIAKALNTWREGDELISELIRVGQDLSYKVDRAASESEVNEIFVRIVNLDDQLTDVSAEFSYILGEGSRWLEQVLMMSLMLLVLTVECTGLALTLSFGRNLSTSLNELNVAAREIGLGHFNTQVRVRSKDELGQLAEAINKMAQELQENVGGRQHAESTSQFKSLFLANMSHEIRTPLAAILGFTELLKNQNLSEAERIKFLEIVERTGHSLTQIVDDVLDLSKVEAGKMEITKKEFLLPDLLKDIYNVLNVRAHNKSIQLHFEIASNLPEKIVSDSLRLKQVLINLISNAIKFTPQGSVSLYAEASQNYLLFTIKDTGIGVSSEMKSRLFQPFSQGDSSITRRFQGTGLGLALSHKLAKALGGDIALRDSKPGSGSTFVFSLPLETIQTANALGKKSISLSDHINSFSGKTILVVDDSEDNRLLLEKLLLRQGLKVKTASNGLDGVAMAMKHKVDFVLMDMQMPVKDGYQATRELRELGFTQPIIAITAHAMKEDRQNCLKAGCDDYLTKPIDMKELIHLLGYYSQDQQSSLAPQADA